MRLYAKVNSDSRKNVVGVGGREEITARLFYGSASDSKLAADVTITWPKGSEKPTVRIQQVAL